MRNGFVALALDLDGPTLDKIPAIMASARKLLQDRLARVELAKFDPRGELPASTYATAHATAVLLFENQEPDKVVFADRAWIQQQCPGLVDAEVRCVRNLVAFVRQDLCTNAQCKIPSAWLSNGFGFWAKVFPGLAVPILEAVAAAYTSVGIACSVSGPAHLICPPKGGASLKSHIDGAPAAKLRADIERFIASGRYSNEDFARSNGMHDLVHVVGGREGSGATCTLVPMTPARMALLLDTIAASDGAKEKAFMLDAHRGPKFYTPSQQVKQDYLAQLRRIRGGEGNSRMDQLVREDGLPVELAWMPMVPKESGPFAIAFPIGYFHMKSANDDSGRISLAGGVDFESDVPAHDLGTKRRRLDYVSAQSRMATDPAAVELVRAEKIPLSEGATHRSPGLAAELMAPGGPFSPLVFTPAEAERLRALVAEPQLGHGPGRSP